MTLSATAEPRTEALYVLFDLGQFVGAIDSRSIERVLSSEEVRISATAATHGSAGIPAVTLASLLDLDLRTRAWLILKDERGGHSSTASRALGIGECLGTRAVEGFVELPSSFFAKRVGALKATFRLSRSVKGFAVGRVGLLVDVDHASFQSDWLRTTQSLTAEQVGVAS